MSICQKASITQWRLLKKHLLNFMFLVLRPVAHPYGHVRTDRNQCFVIDCSLSHPAGHKPFTCSHSVFRNAWLNIQTVRWMRLSARLSVHVFTTSQMYLRHACIYDMYVFTTCMYLRQMYLRHVFTTSLFVLIVDRCCRFSSVKPAQNSRQ